MHSELVAKIARDFRRWMEGPGYNAVGGRLPRSNTSLDFRGCCFSASERLYHIYKREGADVEVISGRFIPPSPAALAHLPKAQYIHVDGNGESGHVFLTIRNLIVDVTADQFYPRDHHLHRVVVTSISDQRYRLGGVIDMASQVDLLDAVLSHQRTRV